MTRRETADTGVLIPGSATDAVHAVRELFGLVKEMVKGGRFVVELYEGRQKKQAARNLAALEFTKAGARPHLERIINGTYTAGDLDAITTQMANTADEVETSITQLFRYRDTIRETYGWEAAKTLDDLLNGPSGKRVIRYSLNDLADTARRPNADPKQVKARAEQVLRWIDELDKGLGALHDELLSIKKRHAGRPGQKSTSPSPKRKRSGKD